MKRKAFILSALCAFGLCTWEAQAINLETAPLYSNIEVDNMPHGFEEIDLLGDLLFNIGPNAIEAGASDNDIYIGFNQSFGNVSISIYNSMGSIVYNTVVNTDVQHVVIIPFTAASGSYTVELSNTHGYVDGDFERN